MENHINRSGPLFYYYSPISQKKKKDNGKQWVYFLNLRYVTQSINYFQAIFHNIHNFDQAVQMGKTIATIYCSRTYYAAGVLHDRSQAVQQQVRGGHCYLCVASEKNQHINNLPRVTQLVRGKTAFGLLNLKARAHITLPP